jgi:hypothetical protein
MTQRTAVRMTILALENVILFNDTAGFKNNK